MIFRILISVIFIAILFFFALDSRLSVTNYEINSAKVSSENSYRIVLIADLHNCFLGEDQVDIISKIKLQNPDIIVLCGDIADNVKPFIGAKVFLEKVVEIAPVYYVTGNHEFRTRNIDNVKADIRKTGVTILDNEMKTVNINGANVNIYGIDDPFLFEYTDYSDEKDWESLLKGLWQDKEGEYNILISHRPEEVDEYKKYNYDLILTGHAHGGQVIVPYLIDGLFAPDQGFFPKYTNGLIEYNNTKQIISRGVANNQKVPRVFNRPEVVVVDIK